MNRDQRRLQLKGQRLEEEYAKTEAAAKRHVAIIERLKLELAGIQRAAAATSRSIAKHVSELETIVEKRKLIERERARP